MIIRLFLNIFHSLRVFELPFGRKPRVFKFSFFSLETLAFLKLVSQTLRQITSYSIVIKNESFTKFDELILNSQYQETELSEEVDQMLEKMEKDFN
jgi:hypothetical protein